MRNISGDGNNLHRFVFGLLLLLSSLATLDHTGAWFLLLLTTMSQAALM